MKSIMMERVDGVTHTCSTRNTEQIVQLEIDHVSTHRKK